MKALSIQQPWAWAILAGIKTVENRTWRTNHRGPLLIHASKTPWPGQADLLGHVAPGELPVGVLLGTVEVLDCVPVGGDLFGRITDPFAVGPWCWILSNPTAFERPVPFQGKPGLFDIADKLISR
jgi:hypothetical protein